MTRFHLLAATAIGLVATLAQVAEAQCPSNRAMAGVILGTHGVRMTIHRAAVAIPPEQTLVVCDGDIVDIETSRSHIKVQLNGSALPSTLVGPTRTPIVARSPTPSVADNVFGVMLERLMPGLIVKRQHAMSRTKNKGVFWNVPGLEHGTALLTAGERALVLGWTADSATYRLDIREGRTGVVLKTETTGNMIAIPARAWTPDDYYVSLYRVDEPAQPVLTGSFKVVETSPPPAPATPAWAGAEFAAATHAFSLIESDPARYGLEALQIIERAPREGLDRTVVYDVIRGAEKE